MGIWMLGWGRELEAIRPRRMGVGDSNETRRDGSWRLITRPGGMGVGDSNEPRRDGSWKLRRVPEGWEFVTFKPLGGGDTAACRPRGGAQSAEWKLLTHLEVQEG